MRRFALVVIAGCGRLGFSDHVDAGVAPDGGPTPLVVTTPLDRLAGGAAIASLADLPTGTPGLSLREALTIAANHPGPDLVTFDASFVTPTTLAVGSALVIGADTSLDATGRGVTIGPGPGYTGTLVDVAGDRVTLTGLGLADSAGDALDASGVADLTLHAVTVRAPGADGLHLEACTHCELDDCRIDHAARDPIFVHGSTDVTVRRASVALATKVGSVHGIEVQASSLVHVIDSFVDPGTAYMIDFVDTSDGEITGNVIQGGDTCITLWGTTQRTQIFRNVLIAPATDSIYVAASVTATTILNNTFYNAPDITSVSTDTTETNTLLSATGADFVAPATFDFHLAAGSTYIDQAADVGQDMLPNSPARFLGAGPDLGAVESY